MKLAKIATILGIIFTSITLMSYHLKVDKGQTIGQVIHVSYSQAYPNKAITPGKADTLAILDLQNTYDCKGHSCTYSQSNRNVSDIVKRQIYVEYNTPYPQNGKIEVDHFYPLCAGGSNDPQNLWIEPEHVYDFRTGEDWGYHKKDRLETWGCALIKKGDLQPIDFFTGIVDDWVAYYKFHQNEIEKISVLGGVPVE